MSDIRLKLREAVLEGSRLGPALSQAEQQLAETRDAFKASLVRRDTLFDLFADGREVTLQDAWDKNLDNLREDPEGEPTDD